METQYCQDVTVERFSEEISWFHKTPKINIIENILLSKPNDLKKTIKEHIINIGSHYKCIICDKKFLSRQQQYYHVQCDEPKYCRPFKCNLCHRGFVTESHFKYHIETHSKNKISCNICEKLFSNKITLNAHLNLHEKKRKFNCDFWSAEKKDIISLKIKKHPHRKISLNKFQCKTCKKIFYVKSHLKRHNFIHNKDRTRTYQCLLCSRMFFLASTLQNHAQKHNSEIKYKCDTCKKYFTEKKTLKRHLSLHKESSIYKCEICDVEINRKDNLFRHIRNMHPCQQMNRYSLRNTKNKGEETDTQTTNLQKIVELKSLKDFQTSYENDFVINIKCRKKGKICNKSLNTMKFMPCSVIKCVGKPKPLNIILSPERLDKNSINENTKLINKNIKKKYDPAEIYRKILFANNEEDFSFHTSALYKKPPEKSFEFKNNDVKTSANSKDEINCSYSNFGEKHWRKNFYS